MTATSSHQITSIHVKVFVAPSDITIFLAALERAQAVVGALPESVSFDLFQNLDMPGEFKYIENWNASLDWIMAVGLWRLADMQWSFADNG
jgi:hypothetical protein